MAARPSLQFSVGALLLVTTVVAVALGIAVALRVPFGHPAVQGLLAGYLIFFGSWGVVRGPRVLSDLRDVQRRRRAIAAKRAAIAEEVRQAKARKPPQD